MKTKRDGIVKLAAKDFDFIQLSMIFETYIIIKIEMKIRTSILWESSIVAGSLLPDIISNIVETFLSLSKPVIGLERNAIWCVGDEGS